MTVESDGMCYTFCRVPLTDFMELRHTVVSNGHNHHALSFSNTRFIFLGIVLVTDAIAAMGLPPGRHYLGTMEVNIEKNRATLVGTNTLAGRFLSNFRSSFIFYVASLTVREGSLICCGIV